MYRGQNCDHFDDKKQITLLNQLYKLQQNLSNISKTIILYDLFNDKNQDQIYLTNLRTIAQVLIDKQLKVSVLRQQKDNNFYNKYIVSQNQYNVKKKKKAAFEIEGPSLESISIYQNEDGDLRVVAFPIEKVIIDTPFLLQKQKALEQEYKNYLQVKNKYLNVFRLQAFLGVILQKTEKISICSLVQICERRPRQINIFRKQFTYIFNVPSYFKPQFILHNYNPTSSNNERATKQSQHSAVTTVFSYIGERFGVHRINCVQQQYFFPTKNISTNLFKNLQSRAFYKVVQDFIKNWNKIVIETSSCIASVVRLASQKLNADIKSISQEKQYNSITYLSSYNNTRILTFNQIFDKYIFPSLYLPQNVKIKEFYNKYNFNQIKSQSGCSGIPSSIQIVTFFHFFKKYYQEQIIKDNDKVKLMNLWKNNLLQLYQLANSINNTFLNIQQNKYYKCQNMQRFVDFLDFAFEAMERVNKITKRNVETHNQLNIMFKGLKPKKDELLKYIISCQSLIKAEEPLQYYDIYMLIIRQNAHDLTNIFQNDIESMQQLYLLLLKIHESKANVITNKFIQDNQKLVYAIKVYAMIARRYLNQDNQRQSMLKCIQIQKKMAHLLIIANQLQFATKVYINCRQVDKAKETLKQYIKNFKGPNLAQKLIQFGLLFQTIFQYDVAIYYYKISFNQAKNTPQKQQALRHIMKCVEKQKLSPTEEQIILYKAFLLDGNLSKLLQIPQLTFLFQNIIYNLVFNSMTNSTIMVKQQQYNNKNKDQSLMSYYKISNEILMLKLT